MKVKNLVLFGFVLSALSYLNDQAKNEDNNDFDFLNNLEDVDLDKIRKEFGDGLENVVGEFGDVVSSIVKIGSEAFDRYLQNYEDGGEETLKKIKKAIDETQPEQDEEVPLRSFFEEKEPDSWAVDLDSFLRGSDEVENNVLTDLNELLNELGETPAEIEKTEEDYLREIEKAVGAQQPENETVEETNDGPLMPEMSDAESDEIDALFSEIIAGEKEAETEKEIRIMDGFEGLEEPAVEEPVVEEPVVEEPAVETEPEEPVQEEPETVEPVEEPEEEPIVEPEVEDLILDEPEVPAEEPVQEEPEVTEPVEEPAQEPEEIPVETEPEEPQSETEEPEVEELVTETLEPVQEEVKELTRSEAIIEEANRYVHDLVADLEEELSMLEEEYRKETAASVERVVEEPAIEEPVVEEPAVETEPEEPVQEEPETVEPVEEPAEEPVEEPTEVVEEPETEEPIVEEPEVPAEEPVQEEPEVTEPVEEPAQEPEEIPVETEPEEQPVVIEPAEEIVKEAPAEEKTEEEPEDRIEIKIEEAPKYQEEDIYAKINDLYPYLSLGFIRSVYELKEVIAEEYPLDKEVIVLHRIRFASVDDLRQFVEIVSNHGYNVNVDENQCIVDIFKQYRNTDGRILTNIFEIANQARLLRGQYEGYRIDVVNEED